MFDTAMLYLLNHTGVECIGVATAVGLFAAGALVKMTFKGVHVPETVIDNTGDALMLAGFSAFTSIGAIVGITVITAVGTPAPDQWLQHLPVKEAQFFQKNMKSGISVADFSLEAAAYKRSILHPLSISQQQRQALAYSDSIKSTKIKTG